MIGILDYGVGNLFSLQSSFAFIGQEAVVTRDPEALGGFDRLVLPGVGAFGDAAEKLRQSGLQDALLETAAEGKPLLGICLGMQLLFSESLEYGVHRGLGLIPGRVVPIREAIPAGLKIPQIGWNGLIFPDGQEKHPLFRYIEAGDCVYFVHSYHATDCGASVIARTEYGGVLTAAAARGNVMGTQFHPEKSGSVGLRILRAFCEL